MGILSKFLLSLTVWLSLAGCGTEGDYPQTSSEPKQAPAGINWKGVLMTGDNSINAFDNARRDVYGQWLDDGVLAENLRQMSMAQSEQTGGVRPSSIANLRTSLEDLDVGEGDGCALFMTSHGSTQGFMLRNQGYLTPDQLDEMVETSCGNHPTVMLISACYAGVFAEPAYQRPNRIILTAARKDRTSFGCSAEARYTYWDGCVLDNLPTAGTWQNFYTQVTACIERKESDGGFTPSFPQGRFGEEMGEMRIFNQ